MNDNPLLGHENPRVVAFARMTGETELDHGFNDWLETMKRAAIEAGGHGVFSFEPGSVPHVNDQAAFTAFLLAQSVEPPCPTEASLDEQQAFPDGPEL